MKDQRQSQEGGAAWPAEGGQWVTESSEGVSYPESLKSQDGNVLFRHLVHLCLIIPIFSFKNVLFFLMSYQHCCPYVCLIITLFSSPQYHKVAFVRAVNQGSRETCEKWFVFNNIFISVLKTDWEEDD